MNNPDKYFEENFHTTLHYKARVAKVTFQDNRYFLEIHSYQTYVDDFKDALDLYNRYNQFIEECRYHLIVWFIGNFYEINVKDKSLDETIVAIIEALQKDKGYRRRGVKE